MAYFAVKLKVAVLKITEADKALSVVLKLYKNALRGNAVDNSHMVLPKMGAHILSHIAVLSVPLAGDRPDFVLGALDSGLLGEDPVLFTDAPLILAAHKVA